MTDSYNVDIDALRFDEKGLIPAVAQDTSTGDVLMMAFMNQEAFMETVRKQEAVYYSRSRDRLWRKGETSGHVQKVHQILLDCDGDCLILKVEQLGGIACHTGTRDCFYRTLKDGKWIVNQQPIRSSDEIYRS